mmetsp:Transcript_104405/g.294323  ORF Transcript_104405/g.294323 Transcript_104405/m.294323 type:complete len:336 (+) Transcript_104405:231-1238(+)
MDLDHGALAQLRRVQHLSVGAIPPCASCKSFSIAPATSGHIDDRAFRDAISLRCARVALPAGSFVRLPASLALPSGAAVVHAVAAAGIHLSPARIPLPNEDPVETHESFRSDGDHKATHCPLGRASGDHYLASTDGPDFDARAGRRKHLELRSRDEHCAVVDDSALRCPSGHFGLHAGELRGWRDGNAWNATDAGGTDGGGVPLRSRALPNELARRPIRLWLQAGNDQVGPPAFHAFGAMPSLPIPAQAIGRQLRLRGGESGRGPKRCQSSCRGGDVLRGDFVHVHRARGSYWHHFEALAFLWRTSCDHAASCLSAPNFYPRGHGLENRGITPEV